MSDVVASGSPSRAAAASSQLSGLDWGLLILRITLGVVFTAHGWMKIANLHQTVAAMSASGIPVPLVYLDILAEFGGGLAILFGLLSRTAALGLIVVMLVAIFHVHIQNGFFMNWFGNQKGEGIEYHLLVIAMSILLILAGPGRISIADPESRLLTKKSDG